MTMLHFTKESLSWRWLIKSFLLVILGTVLIPWLFAGCGQQNRDKSAGFIDLWRVGDKAIPATAVLFC